MRPTTKKTYDEIVKERPACERRAVFNDHVCQGRSTMEHALIYAGKQIIDKWAIIRLCAYSHGVDEYQDNNILDKGKNQLIALMHATPEDLAKYPKANWEQLQSNLENKYGIHASKKGAKGKR